MFSCLLTRFSHSLKTDITKIRSLLWGLPRYIDSIFKRNQMQKSSLRISEFYRYNKKTIQSDTKFFGLNDRYMTCDNCDRMYLISLIYYKEIYHSAITSARTENYQLFQNHFKYGFHHPVSQSCIYAVKCPTHGPSFSSFPVIQYAVSHVFS